MSEPEKPDAPLEEQPAAAASDVPVPMEIRCDLAASLITITFAEPVQSVSLDAQSAHALVQAIMTAGARLAQEGALRRIVVPDASVYAKRPIVAAIDRVNGERLLRGER